MTVLTADSASLFDWAKYGGENKGLMLFRLQNYWNSALMNFGPLSEMIERGIPNRLNMYRSSDVVASPDVDLRGCTSLHLLWESIKTNNNMNPSTGRAGEVSMRS